MSDTRATRGAILFRALRLRCPRCGGDKLFRGYFRMNKRCAKCGLVYDKEPGYFLGSIYYNYGFTAVVMTISYISLFLFSDIDPDTLLWSHVAFCFIFPLWFFRYARALWLAMDECFDRPAPPPPTRRRQPPPAKV